MKPLWITFSDPAFAEINAVHFSPSWERYHGGKVDLVRRRPETEFGDFGTDKFNNSFARQIACLHDIVRLYASSGRTIIWSDTDMRFYGDVLPDVEEAVQARDLTTSRDRGTHCTGFCAFRASFKMVRFLEDWMDLNNLGGWEYAQLSFNELLQRGTVYRGFFPYEEYWNFGCEDSPVLWEAGMAVNPPASIKLHHANFTKGIKNKLALLQAVRDKVGHD